MPLATTPAPAAAEPSIPTLEECARVMQQVVVALAALEAVPCSESHELLLEQAERLRGVEQSMEQLRLMVIAEAWRHVELRSGRAA